MGDENENERLGPPWVLFTDDGAPVAILPAGRPGQVARILATSLEDAARIVAITNAMRAQRDELEKDRDMWRGECESLSRELGLPPTMRPAEGELARFYSLALAQRDEARELVRRYVDAEMDPTDEDGDGRRGAFLASRNAVARWDEEEKKR